jgi:hypothetical protein
MSSMQNYLDRGLNVYVVRSSHLSSFVCLAPLSFVRLSSSFITLKVYKGIITVYVETN